MRRGCPTGKVRYPSKGEAEWKMDRVKRSLRAARKHEPVRAYECSLCGGWHLTSSAPTRDPVRVRPLRRVGRGAEVPRTSADERWRFVHEGSRWFVYLDDSERPFWPEGHVVLADAVADVERSLASGALVLT